MTRIVVETRSSREQAVSDVALLERVAEGDGRALSELSARHSLSLRALAFGILRDAVQAEQVVQTTFREVRYEAGRFDPAHFPVFGEPESEPILGVFALEGFRLAADPVNRRLISVPGLLKTA